MKKLMFMMSLAVLLLAACDKADKSGDPSQIEMSRAASVPATIVESMNLTEGETYVAELANEAALTLLAESEKGNKDQNVVLSPLSLATCMALVANGAAGDTQSEMLKALWHGASLEQVNALYAKVSRDLPRLDKDVTFNIANSLWLASGFKLQPTFEKTATDTYHTDMATNVPFGTTAASDAISRWTCDATSGIIKDFGKHFDSNSYRMAIVNALYFKGSWTHAFDKDFTHDANFTDSKTLTKKVPTMCKEDNLYSSWDNGVTMVELPYGKQGKYYLELLMPELGKIHDFVTGLTAARLNAIDGSRTLGNKVVFVPRFTLSHSENLKDMLQRMGIVTAFTGSADFSPMTAAEHLQISKIVQDTYIAVEETGTEAAAATAVTGDTSSPGHELWFNRPFVFLLRERESGAIIVAGKVASVQQ